jgi:hypothetical protein
MLATHASNGFLGPASIMLIPDTRRFMLCNRLRHRHRHRNVPGHSRPMVIHLRVSGSNTHAARALRAEGVDNRRDTLCLCATAISLRCSCVGTTNCDEVRTARPQRQTPSPTIGGGAEKRDRLILHSVNSNKQTVLSVSPWRSGSLKVPRSQTTSASPRPHAQASQRQLALFLSSTWLNSRPESQCCFSLRWLVQRSILLVEASSVGSRWSIWYCSPAISQFRTHPFPNQDNNAPALDSRIAFVMMPCRSVLPAQTNGIPCWA